MFYRNTIQNYERAIKIQHRRGKFLKLLKKKKPKKQRGAAKTGLSSIANGISAVEILNLTRPKVHEEELFLFLQRKQYCYQINRSVFKKELKKY